MLVCEIVLFQADHVVNDLPIHFFCGSKINVMIFCIFTLTSLDEAEGVNLDQFTLREGVTIDELHLD